jgi:uncharacterized repeat protein (TIGR01451 family)
LLTVSNAGPVGATDVVVSDPLPAGVAFVSASGDGWVCGLAATTVTCTRPSLAAGANAPGITIDVDAPAEPQQLTNTASVSSSSGDAFPANDSANETTTVTALADLALSKQANVGSVLPGAPVTYTLTVTNLGPSSAADLTLTDWLPAGSSFVSATGDGWSCAELSGIVTCTTPSLSVGAAPVVTVGILAPEVGGDFVNTASVSTSTSDPNQANDVAVATVRVDLEPAEVTQVRSVASSADGVVAAGESLDACVTQLAVAFDEAVTGADLTSSYLLVNAGGDGALDTATCDGGAHPNDEAVSHLPLLYDESMHTAWILVGGNDPLGPGLYRLLACAGGIHDAVGFELDGDGDGSPGGDFASDFEIGRAHRLANPKPRLRRRRLGARRPAGRDRPRPAGRCRRCSDLGLGTGRERERSRGRALAVAVLHPRRVAPGRRHGPRGERRAAGSPAGRAARLLRLDRLLGATARGRAQAGRFVPRR